MKCPHCSVPIDEHEASLCFDAWVAEAVMGGELEKAEWAQGWVLWTDIPGQKDPQPVKLPRYSTDIAAAWDVVGHFFGAPMNIVKTPISYWVVDIYSSEREIVVGNGKAATAPLAICHAALKAVSDGRS